MLNFVQLKRFDTILFILMVLLIIFGLVVQYSLSLAISDEGAGDFSKQYIFALIGLVLFFVIVVTDFRFIRSSAYLIYIITILLLIGVLFFGNIFRGVQGWLSFGAFNFQPAELAKLTAIIILAKFWEEARLPVRPKHVLVSFALILPLVFLIIRQPDLGSALMIVILWFGILFLVDKNKKHFIGLLIIFILIVSSAWLYFLTDTQKGRLLTYINPQGDPLGRGYQITQSIVAVGSGEIVGRGFGLGTQSQLRFLPAGETDFIFAVLAEEFGFIGCLLLLGFFLALFYRLIRLARRVYDNFGLILILGITLFIFFQTFINIGMNIGLVPVVGIPLPFVSYGGSSLLITMISIGLVQSVITHQPFTKI